MPNSQITLVEIDRNFDGGIDESRIFTYDEYGNVDTQVTLNSDGSVRSIYQYRYEPTEEPVFNEPLLSLQRLSNY